MNQIICRVIDAYAFRVGKNELEFLMLKRAEKQIYEHLWQGVAGKIEPGETAVEAAVRELKEETGLTPTTMFVADHVSRFYEAYADRINLVPVFGIGVDDSKVILSKEHSKFEWCSFEKALKKLVWNGQKEGLSEVYNMLNSADGRIKWSSISLKD